MSAARLNFMPLLAFLIIALMLVSINFAGKPKRGGGWQEISREVSDFSLPLLIGKGEFKSLELKGRVTILSIFASWCLPCAAEHEFLMKIASDKRLEGKAIQLIGINWRDKENDALAYLEKRGNPYSKTAIDKKGGIAVMLGIAGVPETFLIDKNGRAVAKFSGNINSQIAEEFITRALKLDANQ